MFDLCYEKGIKNLQLASCVLKWDNSFVCDMAKNMKGFFLKKHF